MKKIIISSVCMIMALTMTGCGSGNEAQALENVNAEVNKVYSIVNSTGMNETSEVSPAGTYSDSTASNQLSNLRERSYQNMIEEDYLRQEALEMCNCLKDARANKYKLGKQNVAALKNLTVELDKYATLLEETKPEVKAQVKAIKKHTGFKTLDMQQATSSYNSLNNLMSERRAYLDNLINTMSEIESILQGSQTSTGNTKDYSTQNTNVNPQNDISNSNYDNAAIDYENAENLVSDGKTENHMHRHAGKYNRWRNRKHRRQAPRQNAQQQEQNNTANNKTPRKFEKNIDTYNNQNFNNQNLDNDHLNNNQTAQNNAVNNHTQPQPEFNKNYNQNNFKGYNQYGGHGYYGQNGWQYNGMPYRNQITNPGRNTDTFYPFRRNIDTYRFNPNNNGYYPQNQYFAANANDNTNDFNGISDSTEHDVNEKNNQNMVEKLNTPEETKTESSKDTTNQAELRTMPKKIKYDSRKITKKNNTQPQMQTADNTKINQKEQMLHNNAPIGSETTTSKKIEKTNNAIKHLIDNTKANDTEVNDVDENIKNSQDKIEDIVMPINNGLAISGKPGKEEHHVGTSKEIKFI